ncbi:MAG: acyclic terpene utilization AtuA family protein, partial [Acidobacteria bacterium]
MKRTVIANCGGFWGDDPTAPRRQVEGGPIDYLVMDYLAEVTMAILQKQRARKPDAGYPADFLTHLRDVLPACVQRGIRIITNAGGVNPLGCRAAVEALANELGIADRVTVAIVSGDDLYPNLDELLASGEPLINMDTGQALSEIRPRV